MEELVNKVLVEIDTAKRDALIKEAYDMGQVQDWAYVPLHQQALAWGVSNKVKVVQRADNQILFYWFRKEDDAPHRPFRVRSDHSRRFTPIGAPGILPSADAPNAGDRRVPRHEALPRCSPSSSAACCRPSVMAVVALIAFTLFRFVGDPVNQMVGIETSAEERAQLRESLGLNDSVLIQFGRFVWHALQFDFGVSYQFKQPVIDLIGERFPATMELALVSALFALALGIPMGVYTGLHRRSVLSNLFMTVSLVGISLPTFLTGILLIFVFSVV